RADAWGQQQLRKVQRTALGSRGKCAMQAASKNVARADVVMGGHDEMRQFGLGLAAVPRERRIFAGNTVRSERAEKLELRRAGVFGPMIGQIDDFTLRRPVDRAVGFVDKAAQVLGVPV